MATILKTFCRRNALAAAAVCCALGAGPAVGQTAFGSATTIVFPLIANTSTFTSAVTLYNSNPADVTVGLSYFDANNTDVPGAKPCSDVVVPANGTVEFDLPSQCTLDASSHFGQLIVSDNAGTNQIFGYSRTQSNAGAGFSVEGFPSANFASETTSATGLKRTADTPFFQSNCFVAAQGDAVTYDINLFDAAGTQIGSTVSGALNAFEQVRYLDIFTVAAAPAGDYSNVRAEFTRTSAGTQQMIGSCTVQESVTFGADFRIAKALTPEGGAAGGTGTPAATWDGSIPTLLGLMADYVFVGSPASITLAATSTVSGYGGGWFAKQSAGVGTVKLAVCYQDQSGPGPITVLGSPTVISVNGTQKFKSAFGSGTLGAATYTVGLCAQNVGTNSVNKNGNTSGFVFVAP